MLKLEMQQVSQMFLVAHIDLVFFYGFSWFCAVKLVRHSVIQCATLMRLMVDEPWILFLFFRVNNMLLTFFCFWVAVFFMLYFFIIWCVGVFMFPWTIKIVILWFLNRWYVFNSLFIQLKIVCIQCACNGV